jgi:hypothetical protein
MILLALRIRILFTWPSFCRIADWFEVWNWNESFKKQNNVRSSFAEMMKLLSEGNHFLFPMLRIRIGSTDPDADQVIKELTT